MINYDNLTKENIKDMIQIIDHPYRTLIIRGSGSGKRNAFLNLINQENVDYDIIDKIYLYAIDQNEAKYQCLIKKKIIEYSNNTQDVYKILKSATQIEQVKH